MALVALMGIVTLASPVYASDNAKVLYYEPKKNDVADRTVHLNVNKLDSSSHDYVTGAKLQIINKETGDVVLEWTSGKSTENIDRQLDVDVVYILHEVEAPEGYEKAQDVEFILRSVNFETKGEVLSGAQTEGGETNAEFQNVAGDIETQAFVISLYDKAIPGERTITQKVERNREGQTQDQKQNSVENSNFTQTSISSGTPANSSNTTANVTGGGPLTKTSDDTSYVPIIVIAVIAVGIIGFAIYKRRQ